MPTKDKTLSIPTEAWELMRRSAEVQGDSIETWARISLALSCAKHLGLAPAAILPAFGVSLPDEDGEV